MTEPRQRTIDGVLWRRCSCCTLWFEACARNFSRSHGPCLQYRCRTCCSAYTINYYAEHKAEIQAKRRAIEHPPMSRERAMTIAGRHG